MTSLLEKAFEVASKLPTLEQNILARTLLDEIKSKRGGMSFLPSRKTSWLSWPLKLCGKKIKARQQN